MKKALMQVLMYVCLMLPLGACSSDTPQEPEELLSLNIFRVFG